MTDLWDLQSDVGHLQAECRDLRIDIDNLLAENSRLKDDIADLQRWFNTLRARVDHNELVAP